MNSPTATLLLEGYLAQHSPIIIQSYLINTWQQQVVKEWFYLEAENHSSTPIEDLQRGEKIIVRGSLKFMGKSAKLQIRNISRCFKQPDPKELFLPNVQATEDPII